MQSLNNHRTLRTRTAALLLALALCLTILPAAAADGTQTVWLDSAADFAAFAKNCSLDTWSQGKTFVLRADISLAGVDLRPPHPSAVRLKEAGIPSPILISQKTPALPGCSARFWPAAAWKT